MAIGPKRRGLVGLGVILSLALAGFSSHVYAAAPGTSGHKNGVKSASRCKTRSKAHGTIKFSSWQFPDTLNPNQTALGVSWEVIYGVLDQLFTFDNKGHVIAQMAASVPTIKNGGIKNGGKMITVHLRKGMRWSDGTEITAADVAFGWKIGMDPNSGPWCGGSCDEITRIDTPNKYTSVWHLKEAYAPAIPNAAPAVWPRKWAGAWDNNPQAATAKLFGDPSFNFENAGYPTSGPYQVAQFVQDDRVVLHPMKYYRTLTCGGYVKNMIFAFYSSKASMIAAAANRETDVTENYTLADVPQLKSHRKAFSLHVDAGFTFEHLQFNVDRTYAGKANPLNNAKVRQALALSLDKSGLIRSALGVTAKQAKQIEAWSFLVVTPKFVQPFADRKLTGQWDPMQKKYDANTGHGRALWDARKLLNGTPFKHGFSLALYTTQGNAVRDAEVSLVMHNWTKLGVHIGQNSAPSSTLLADWDKGGIFIHGGFQVALWTTGGPADPDQLKYLLQSQYVDRTQKTHAAINGNYSGIRNHIIDRAFNGGAHSFQYRVRAANYVAAQREVNKQAYWIPLYYRPGISTADSRFTPFSSNPVTDITWNMFAWKVRGS